MALGVLVIVVAVAVTEGVELGLVVGDPVGDVAVAVRVGDGVYSVLGVLVATGVFDAGPVGVTVVVNVGRTVGSSRDSHASFLIFGFITAFFYPALTIV